MKLILSLVYILAGTSLLAQSASAPINTPYPQSANVGGAAPRSGLVAQVSRSAAITPDSRDAQIRPGESSAKIFVQEEQASVLPPAPTVIVVPREQPRTVTFDDIEFVFGQTTILASSQAEVAKIATLLNEDPNSAWRLVGHTDFIGSESDNTALSFARARALIDILVTNYGIDHGRLFPEGMGESDPVASNETSEGRQRNRRVVMIRI